ncbi:BA14K family protein [Rhizobium sp. CG5]|nr:BA14K family protein [Rhizobium sp. CG5]
MTLTRKLSVCAVGVLMALTSIPQASAAALPVAMPTFAQASQNTLAEPAQYRRHQVRRGYYNGHRGYRDRRPGYRRNSDGYWYPLAAFGAIIGGAIVNQNQPRATSSRHVQWCADRYRSYRSSDNTYAPRVGVRARCNSPYN